MQVTGLRSSLDTGCSEVREPEEGEKSHILTSQKEGEFYSQNGTGVTRRFQSSAILYTVLSMQSSGIRRTKNRINSLSFEPRIIEEEKRYSDRDVRRPR